MDRNRGPWDEGQQAWSRLEAWYQNASIPRTEETDDDQRALQALEDSGLIRRMLDQVEFEAVRAARGHGKSWAEIAVKLGVARQSAWERWRDVDEPESEAEPARPAESDVPGDGSEVAAELGRSAARKWRRRSTIVVPDAIGMTWDVARKVIGGRDLVALAVDADSQPLGALSQPDGVVVDQSPEAGAKVPLGSIVRLYIERGGDGGAGVREPRRPAPDPKSAQALRDELIK